MADKIFQPMMSQPGTPVYIQQGVEDRSKAVEIGAQTDLMKNLGNMAVDAWKGYEVARVERSYEDTIDAYMKGDVNYFKPEAAQEIQQAGRDVQENALALEAQWESPSVTYEGISASEKSLSESQQRLSRALEQGAITSEEFEARLLTNLREAINRAPGFSQELVAQTKKVMDLSGMSDFMRLVKTQKDAQAKEQQAMIGIYTDAIKQAEINPADYGNNIVVAGQAAIRVNQQRKGVEDTLKGLDVLQKQGKLNREMVDQIVSSPEFLTSQSVAQSMLHSTIQNNYASGSYVQNKAPGMSEVDANIIGMQQEVEKQRSVIRGLLAAGSEASRPAINDYLKQLDTMQATYESIFKGKFTAEEKQAKLSAVSAAAKLPFATGDAGIEHLNKLLSGLEHYKNATGRFPEGFNQSLLNQYSQFVQNQMRFLEGGTEQHPLATVDLGNKNGQQTAFLAMSFITDPNAVGGLEKTVSDNDKNVKNIMTGLQSITNPKQYTQVTDTLVKLVNVIDESKAPFRQFLSAEASSSLVNHFEMSMGQVARGSKLDYDKATNRLIVTDMSGKMLSAPTERFNALFRASNKVRGRSSDESIDKYGEDILRIYKLAQKEIPTQEVSGRIKGR